jgi:hypothetical protein
MLTPICEPENHRERAIAASIAKLNIARYFSQTSRLTSLANKEVVKAKD